MDSNCSYCSEIIDPSSADVVEEVTTWHGPSHHPGEAGREIQIKTGRRMHTDCAYLNLDEERQIPGQAKLI